MTHRVTVTYYGSLIRQELEASEAARLVKLGLVWPDGGYMPEAAVLEPTERAVMPRPRKRPAQQTRAEQAVVAAASDMTPPHPPAGKKRKPKGY